MSVSTSAFTSLGTEKKIQLLLQYEGPCRLLPSERFVGAEVHLPSDEETLHLSSLSGKDAGAVLEGLLIPSGKTAKLEVGELTPRYGHVLISINPDLLEVATVSCPAVLEPVKQSLSLIIQARASVDLHAYPWIARLYLVQ